MKTAQDYFDEGKILFDKGSYPEAINLFDQAIALDEKFMEAYRFKCRSLNSLGQHQNSLEWCDKAIAIDPTYKYAYNLKGNALSDLGDKQLALEAYEKALSLDPNFGLALNGKANVLGDLGRIEEAIECYKLTIKIDPDNRYAYGNLASHYYQLGLFDEALETYNMAVSKHPTNLFALTNRGRLLSFLGKNREALEDMKTIQNLIQKGHVEADLTPEQVSYMRKTLKQISALENTFDQAEAELQKAIESNSNVQKYVEKFKQLSKQKEETTKKCIQNLNTNNDATHKQLKEEVKRMREQMADFQKQLIEVRTQVKSIQNQLEILKEEVDNKLNDYKKMLEKELGKLDLKLEDQNKVKEYFRAFIETFSSAHVTSQVIDSGLIQLDSDNTKATILSTIASFTPYIGDLLSKGIKSLGDFLQSREMKKNAKKMKELATDPTDLSQTIGQTAFEVVLHTGKQKQILKITFQDMKQVSGSVIEKLNKFCQNLEDEINAHMYTSLYKTPQALLGHQDANNLIQEWIDMKILFEPHAEFKERIISKIDDEGNIIKGKGEDSSTSPDLKPVRTHCCNLF